MKYFFMSLCLAVFLLAPRDADAQTKPAASASAAASGAPAGNGAKGGDDAGAKAGDNADARDGAGGDDSSKGDDKPPAPQTKAFIGYHFIAVRSVDLRAQTFYADFYMWLRFSGADDDRANDIEQKLEFMNGKPDVLQLTDKKNIDADTRYLAWRVSGTFNFVARLQKYPFDTQNLNIEIENSDLELAQMIFVNDVDTYKRAKQPDNLWGMGAAVDVPEFRLKKATYTATQSIYDTDFGDTSPDQIGAGTTYSRATVNLQFQRDYWPYVLKILLPLAVIVGMSYLVFFISAAEVSTASGIAITALLSCIAFNVAVEQNMPEVGYLVVSDKFFIGSYFLVFLTLVESIGTHVLTENGKEHVAIKMDRWSRILFPILFLAMFGYLLLAARTNANG